MTVIYVNRKHDQRHRHLGVYADVSGCFELPVGPFNSRDQAQTWVEQNSERLVALYGAGAASVSHT